MTSPIPHSFLDLAVIGGGASGFYAAIRTAEHRPGTRIAVFERGNRFLQKVKISGGGRCNVTHACYDPAALSTHYPRGGRELKRAFRDWQPSDMVQWFRERGVTLKTEADGRIFPATDSSDTIIDCFLDAARAAGISLRTQTEVVSLESLPDGGFKLSLDERPEPVFARCVAFCTGSLKSNRLLGALLRCGHPVEPLNPSLFAMNVSDRRLHGLAGVSVPEAAVFTNSPRQARRGPLLITHRGLSGPAILRLSAWEAPALAALNHHFPLHVNWLPEHSRDGLVDWMEQRRRVDGGKNLRSTPPDPLPRRLWERFVDEVDPSGENAWASLAKPTRLSLLALLQDSVFAVTGKTTNKDEFVTCGGVLRQSIEWSTMESKTLSGLFFAGECIDVDGITGGFNFQSAWTTGEIAARGVAKRLG